MSRFRKLQSGDLEWSGAIREYVHEQEDPKACIYCGSAQDGHRMLRSCGGPDVADNVVMACRRCNSSNEHRNEVPRAAEGKYLKLLVAEGLDRLLNSDRKPASVAGYSELVEGPGSRKEPARSKIICATSRTRRSDHLRPTIWAPTGIPSSSRPIGITATGLPVALNGIV